MKTFLCMIGLHKYIKILVFTITVGKKKHDIHGQMCIRCGYTPPIKGKDYAKICGKQ